VIFCDMIYLTSCSDAIRGIGSRDGQPVFQFFWLWPSTYKLRTIIVILLYSMYSYRGRRQLTLHVLLYLVYENFTKCASCAIAPDAPAPVCRPVNRERRN